MISIAAQIEACERFKASDDWLPGLLEHLKGIDETEIRQRLLSLEKGWRHFTWWFEADLLFSLISRVTIFPDRAGIQINLPTLAKLVDPMPQECQRAEAGKPSSTLQGGEGTRQASHTASA